MSDRTAVALTIGGTIKTRADLVNLAEALISEDLGLDYNGGFSDVDEAVEAIRAAAAAGRPLKLFANEVAGGYVEEATGTCENLELDYLRADDGHYAFAASHTSCRDGRVAECAGTIDGGPSFDLGELDAAIKSQTPEAFTAYVAALVLFFSKPGALVLEGDALLPVEDNEETEAA